MSEQTIQDGLYSIPVRLDQYICRSLGATTIKDLVKSKEISGLTLKECNNIKANKPDVLVLNKNKEIVIFMEMKQPSEFNSEELKRIAKYQELLVAKQTKAKIYIISDGDTFIWFNPQTEEHILDEAGNPVLRKITPKDLTQEQNKELAEFIDDVCYCIDDTNNQLIPKDYIDPTPLAKKTAKILQNMSLSSAKNSLYTFVEMFTFKFLSDIGVLKGVYCFDNVYNIYKEYKTNKTHSVVLNTVNENPRAKLIPINHFNKDNNWDINLCWSNEEKEALGIKKKDNLMSLNEFNTFVDELIEDIKNYQEAIKCLED